MHHQKLLHQQLKKLRLHCRI